MTVKTDRSFPLNPLTIETKPAFEVTTDGRYLVCQHYGRKYPILSNNNEIFLSSRRAKNMLQTYNHLTLIIAFTISIYQNYWTTFQLHGMKNKASKFSDNVWGFRQFVLRSRRGLQIMNFGVPTGEQETESRCDDHLLCTYTVHTLRHWAYWYIYRVWYISKHDCN